MRVKDSKYKYVVVCSKYYARYGKNAFIEPQAQTNNYEDAMMMVVSFQNCDNMAYQIIKINNEEDKQ